MNKTKRVQLDSSKLLGFKHVKQETAKGLSLTKAMVGQTKIGYSKLPPA